MPPKQKSFTASTRSVSAGTCTLPPPQVPSEISGDGQIGKPPSVANSPVYQRELVRPDVTCVSVAAGIDTLRIWLEDFQIAENNAFTLTESIQPSGETSARPLYVVTGETEEEGRVVEATKAHCNTSKLQATLHGTSHLYVQTSLPKLLYATNTTELNQTWQIDLSLAALEKALMEIGVHADVYQAKISRLDVAHTVSLPMEVRKYSDTIRSLTFPRTSRQFYYSGAIWKNKSRQLCIYDKTKEQTGKDSNLCRLEYRLMRGKAVERHADVTHVSHLLTNFLPACKAFSAACGTLLNSDTNTTMNSTGTGYKAVMLALLEDEVHAPANKVETVKWLATAPAEERDRLEEAILETQGKQALYRKRKKWRSLEPYTRHFTAGEVSRAEMLQHLQEAFTIHTD